MADRIVGTGPGLATVVVLRGTDGVKVTEFQPFPGYFGGVFVAAGDLNGDGKAEVVVTPDAIDAFSGPFGDQLLVRVYNGAALVGVTSIAPVLAAFDGLASLDGTSGQNNF